MKKITMLSLALVLAILFNHCSQPEKSLDWTHFRGSQLNGIAESQHVPLEWSDTKNILWKAEIPGKGWSSPVVLGEQIWMTTSTEEGKELWAVCADLNTGTILHKKLIFEPDSVYRKHAVNSYATPTPAIEQGFVYVHFGRYGTACINTSTAETVWQRNDFQCEHIQGPGSSLLLHRDKLIVHFEGSDIQYIVALNKKTGDVIWKVDRPKEVYDKMEYIGKKAYITPIVVKVKDKELLISNGSGVCIAYDVETGEEVWRIVQGEDSTIAMPTEENGIVYFYTGFVTPEEGDKYAELLAVNPDGEGDIASSNIIWRMQAPVLQLLTPLVKDGLLYTIDSKANLFCLDIKNGNILWEEKLKGKYHSSPVYVNGHIFFSTTKGKTLVYKAGKEKQLVAENKLEGEIWATPAVVDNSMLVRTSEFLYRIKESD